jgi:hypothetical protein
VPSDSATRERDTQKGDDPCKFPGSHFAAPNRIEIAFHTSGGSSVAAAKGAEGTRAMVVQTSLAIFSDVLRPLGAFP